VAFVLLGALALVVIVTLVWLFITAQPKMLARVLRYVGAGLLFALAIWLALEDRVGIAVLLGSMAWGLFTGGRVWPGGWPHYHFPGSEKPDHNAEQDIPRSRSSTMSRAEALKVLGLEEGATEEDIRAAHKKLMMQNHPDRGGSDYLASKINEAKDVLLGV
jgi:hypothetical protein